MVTAMSTPTSRAEAPALPADVRPSGEEPYWKPGRQVWWRYWPRAVRPMRVIRDDADGLVAWMGPRTPLHKSVTTEGKDLRSIPLGPARFTAPRATKRDVWHGPGILKVAPTGMPWSIWLFWGNDGTFHSWYVNLEQTHHRDDNSVYTRDHVLDLVVYPNRRVEWKDRDELAAAVEAGRFSAEQAAQYEDNARAVERTVAEWGSPFCDGWERWRPDSRWPLGSLPPGVTATF